MPPQPPADGGEYYDGEYRPDEVSAEHLAALDFQVFHPLDHRPWSRRCRTMHGGGRHHLALAWSYQLKPRWLKMVFCPLGFHDPVTWRWRHGHTQRRCANCDLPMTMVKRWRGDDWS